MIVEQFKKATEAAIDWEKQVTALKLSLPAAFRDSAESIQEWVESVSGGMGSVEADMRVIAELFKAGMGVEEGKRALLDIQNAAAKLGISVEDLGLKFAEIKERGEVPERFFKEFPALAPIARGLGMPEHPTPEWMLRTLLPNIAPGGLQSPVRMEVEQTAAAQLAKFGVELENVSQTLGVELLPTLKDWLKEFRESIPQIGATAKKLGEDLGIAFTWIHKNMGWLFSDIAANRYPGQRTVEAMHESLFSTAPPDMATHNMLFKDSAVSLHRAAAANADSAEKLNRALSPK
jgi:hypothetical protein